MEIINDIESLKEMIGFWKRSNLKIGFVPTMGYLHNGHGSLVNLAKTKASKIIVSIFVNPTQFNDPEDLKKYPIDLPRDFSLLKELNVDAVFVPTPAMI
ncbi:MAG: pantoate--beta-alanine ligase, partial [bacterium]|nr:pantoate--beta-alanine ligase [bacterium]